MAKQLSFTRTSGWGGKRTGAGRPNRSGAVNHMKREKIDFRYPLHINLHLKAKLPTLRRKHLFNEFKKSVAFAKQQGLSVIHFSIQSNHIHLFCEAKSNEAVSLGMRSLAGRFAKEMRKYIASLGGSDHGSVFEGRYHVRSLRTPRETKDALEYVLLNRSKHEKLIEYVDTYSSGWAFHDWKKLLGRRFGAVIQSQFDDFESFKLKRSNLAAASKAAFASNGTKISQPPSSWNRVLSEPHSWLAREGWKRACA